MRKSRIVVVLSLFIIVAVLIAVPGTTPTADARRRTQVRWFVGLGAGSDAPTIPAQEAFVEKYNESQDEIELIVEFVDNNSAYDVLNTQLASGNAPDIVGPVGIRGRASFPGAWLDLEPLVEETGYDLSDFDPALVDFYRTDDGLVGLPFAVFPSFIFVNKDLFDEAGVPYPPQEYGAMYTDWNGVEREWNIDTLTDLAMYMTVDEDGNDATMDAFNPDAIVQFGFGVQWADLRARATLFGAGSLIDENGNAQMPEHWREALHWNYDAMWENWFTPNAVYNGSDIMNNGNWFESGNMAMAQIHLWYSTCCMWGLEANWDIAVIPSYQGTTTAKLHADTFSIPKSSKNPDAAFEVLTYMLGDGAGELTQIYGGMPARLSLQDSFFDILTQNEFFADVNWDVAVQSLSYPDIPSHEGEMPAFLEISDRYGQLTQLMEGEPDLDLDAEIDKLIEDIQVILDSQR
jgi:multiple sugar transport system substrate-binding protein